VVDPAVFRAARSIIEERSRQLTDEEMLQLLSSTFSKKHALSSLVIDETDGMPSSSAYRQRFGSLVRAYRLVGYVPHRDYAYIETNRALRTVYSDVIAQTMAAIEAMGSLVLRDPETDLLRINDEFNASIVIARCQQTGTGALRWKVRFDAGLNPDITLVVRMARENEAIHDYYLLPKIDFQESMLRLREDNGVFLDAYRFDSLDALAMLSQRIQIEEAA
jgi:hypothetical protein